MWMWETSWECCLRSRDPILQVGLAPGAQDWIKKSRANSPLMRTRALLSCIWSELRSDHFLAGFQSQFQRIFCCRQELFTVLQLQVSYLATLSMTIKDEVSAEVWTLPRPVLKYISKNKQEISFSQAGGHK